MSDDLVKRLRLGGDYAHDTEPMHEAADRIEALESQLAAADNMLKEYESLLEHQLVQDEFNLEWDYAISSEYREARK